MIIEKIVPFTENSYGFIKSEFEDLDFAHLVLSSKNLNDVICSTLLSENEGLPSYDFKKYITNFNTKLLNHALYITTTYMPFNLQINNALTQKFLLDIPELDFILNISFGQIIYTFQLEQIYSYYSADSLNATAFRKGINMKKHSSFDIAKEVKVNKNISLMDLINDRMIYGFVLHPNYKGARILNKLAINNSLV